MCRLNHELFPDPGNPIANTTVPLLALAGATVSPAGAVAAGATSAGGASATAASDPSTAVELAAATAAGAAALERDPPRPPRLRRRRDGRGVPSPAGEAGTASEPASDAPATAGVDRPPRRGAAAGTAAGTLSTASRGTSADFSAEVAEAGVDGSSS